MIAFKEWSLVCQALGDGSQSLVLRKGGIAEGKAGFTWKHDEFALFPTHFHEQENFFNAGGPPLPAEPDLSAHTISLVAKVELKALINDWSKVQALRPYHSWKEEMIRERFEYTGDQEISVALLRVFRLPEPITFPDARNFGGCRSWVEVPVPEALMSAATPVISEEKHQEILAAVRSILGDS